MADFLPMDIISGDANRGSTVHASDKSLSDLSRSHKEEDISRLQSAFKAYSDLLTYELGDVVVEAGVRYSNITPITVPESFTPAKWEAFATPLTALEIEARGKLGLTSDQVVPASLTAILWDENFFDGDASKIVDTGSGGVIRLHNGKFELTSSLALNISGGGSQSAILVWQSSSLVGGPFTTIPNPAARAAAYTIGNSSVTTKPEASAIIDAQAADVFVRAVLTPTASTDILNSVSEAKIVSFGTSAVANTPLDTAGDILVHGATSIQRKPIGTAGQVLTVDLAEPDKTKWATPAAGGGAVQSHITIHTPKNTLYSIVPSSSSVAKILPASNYIKTVGFTTDFEIDNTESDGHDRIKYTGPTKKFMVLWFTRIRNLSANTHYFGIIQKNSTGASAGTQIDASYSQYFAMPNTDSYFPISGGGEVTLTTGDKINFASGQNGGTLNHFNREVTVVVMEILE